MAEGQTHNPESPKQNHVQRIHIAVEHDGEQFEYSPFFFPSKDYRLIKGLYGDVIYPPLLVPSDLKIDDINNPQHQHRIVAIVDEIVHVHTTSIDLSNDERDKSRVTGYYMFTENSGLDINNVDHSLLTQVLTKYERQIGASNRSQAIGGSVGALAVHASD